MISRELVKKVIYEDTLDIDKIISLKFVDEYLYINGYKKINIHELAYKCKVWADKKGYVLMSGKINGIWYCEYSTNTHYANNGSCYYGIKDEFSNESEAIFKACQWILENK